MTNSLIKQHVSLTSPHLTRQGIKKEMMKKKNLMQLGQQLPCKIMFEMKILLKVGISKFRRT